MYDFNAATECNKTSGEHSLEHQDQLREKKQDQVKTSPPSDAADPPAASNQATEALPEPLKEQISNSQNLTDNKQTGNDCEYLLDLTTSSEDACAETLDGTKEINSTNDTTITECGDDVKSSADVDSVKASLDVDFSLPPTPTSVKPLVEFTSHDTIALDTSTKQQRDDHESLIVHADDTLSVSSLTSLQTPSRAASTNDLLKTDVSCDDIVNISVDAEEPQPTTTDQDSTADVTTASTCQEEAEEKKKPDANSGKTNEAETVQSSDDVTRDSSTGVAAPTRFVLC